MSIDPATMVKSSFISKYVLLDLHRLDDSFRRRFVQVNNLTLFQNGKVPVTRSSLDCIERRNSVSFSIQLDSIHQTQQMAAAFERFMQTTV